MSIKIKSPTFPESVADGTVANWLKKEGENVNQDEVIAEIETDKGHDSFLLDEPTFLKTLKAFIDSMYEKFKK